MAESSSTVPSIDKPVIVRVKRKAFQSAIDAFLEELKTKKILVRHVETVTSSEDTFDVLRSFVPNPSDELKSKEKNEEGRRNINTGKKQDQLLVKAKQSQEVISRNARFEQIWRSRKGKKDSPEYEAIHEMCRLYDVVRVTDTDVDDCRMMADYLPLLKEVLPTAALEIEHDINDYMSTQASAVDYVYDFYAFKEEANVKEGDSASLFPLVQVDDDDDYYDGPDDSEYGTDDSNAEDNPLNDYPDEEISEDEDEVTSTASDEKSQVESQTSESQSEELGSGSEVSYEHSGHPYRSNNADQFLEDDWCSDVDGNANQFFEDESYFEGDDESFW
ncbi:UNVERIFIED_CONTAM: RNA-directed DNA methylation 4 [Sesamum radiatum]|uniref:RNA-directed DNA methylation 4 n=1 Tax=Sesamum radiatum TaxID=300843 RepID=A0AAW2W229_SESRA